MSDSAPTLERVARVIELAIIRHGVSELALEGTLDDARAALDASGNDEREKAVEVAWEEVRERLNREHREGIIDYRELKAGLNNAAIIRDAARTQEQSDG